MSAGKIEWGAGTPGPWEIHDGANSHVFDGRIQAGEKCIAFVECETNDDADMPMVSPSIDARAIAEVPAMVQALRAIQHSVQQGMMPGNDYRRELRLSQNICAAILARIDGEG